MNHHQRKALDAYERASTNGLRIDEQANRDAYAPQNPPVPDALGCMGGQGRSAREIAEGGQLMIGIVVFGVSLLAVFGLAALIRLVWIASK